MTARRTALVTGASRGIGRAIAERLAAEGFDLTLSARTDGPLKDAADELRAHGQRVETAPADMADPAEVEALADAHLELHGGLDVLVLAAGMGAGGELSTYPLNRFDTMMSVNVRSALLLTQRLLPALRTAGSAPSGPGAKIIAIASITGVVSEPGLAAYGASKAALISLCESITVAEGGRGVSATALSPGYVDTDMAAWVHDRVDPSSMIRASDIAELTVALCRLSRHAAVPNIVVTRPGETLWRA
ncbi:MULTISPECIES: SDR family NAD(P)-dependent oxidoreductase [Streptomyces]|uniref:Beta-ketoacyl-ACP reductase n=1 Tax=Streptomyces aurantiogriseus TaxID=66870 RepID=A0A918FNH2_9ACTN|nr:MULTISPECIES: SDR family oxidoreductase [Streptomyces]WUB59297.1 SDR family oxidoreductase [Streptomyces sp. NBC_00582]GGR59351.1 beta-ketoacyl-ACP reductase [Streptomyces aurantiogriseus]GKQ40252.1 beta-ketoacyl-ACP reductase [Streptomyces sp. A012304]